MFCKMAAVCESCLSSGRALSRVQPSLRRLLAALLSDAAQGFSCEKVTDINICWECTALLKKMVQFKLRAVRAREWLEQAYGQGDTEVIVNAISLSSLKVDRSTILDIPPELITFEECSEPHYYSDDDSSNLREIKLESPLDEILNNKNITQMSTNVGTKDINCDVKNINILKVEIKMDESIEFEPTTSARRRKDSTKDAPKERSKRRGMQYGYMYDKLKISELELWKMRKDEKREVGFASASHKCETCIIAFRSEAMWKKHKSIQHSEKLANACAVCSKKFGTRADRERHQSGHYFCYKCKKCDLLFLQRDAVCRHYKKDEHHRSSDKSCAASEVAVKSASSSECIKHPSIHKDYRCAICNKLFTLKGNFTKHMALHTRKLQHQCDICSRHFKKRAYLIAHMLTHTGEKPHQCNICSKQFSLKANLKQHMLVHTLERRHQCEICSKCFSQRGTLKQHMVTHTGEKAHQCEVCSKSFTMKQYLKQHMLFHTGELPHQCDICSKRFGLKSKLERHILTHSGGKPYQCNVCSKSFAYKATLKQHMILHTFEPKHQCDVCKKCFTQAKSLRLHSMIHTGERPFGCEVCGKRFSYEQALQRHMFTHTGEQPHSCEVCGKRFSLKANLKMHVSKVHKVERVQNVVLPRSVREN